MLLNLVKVLVVASFLNFNHVSVKHKIQRSDPFKKYKMNSLFNVEDIKDIQITNEWTKRKWHLSKKSLECIKDVLKKSYYLKNVLILKPGHLDMQIMFTKPNNITEDKLTLSYFYIYNESVFFDPGFSEEKKRFPLSIELSKTIDWDSLK